MAAIPQSLTEKNRRSSEASRKANVNLSHGRGGAGNIGLTASDLESPDLTTPTLKGAKYTTGRGGSGNMANNNDPEAARRAQDVEAQPRRSSTHSTHVGRGGAANIFHPSADEIAKAREDNSRWESAVGDDSSSYHSGAADGAEDTGRGKKKIVGAGAGQGEKGLADRGKEFLFGLGKK